MLTLYLISTMLLILAPGPNMVMMIALASSQGARAGRSGERVFVICFFLHLKPFCVDEVP